MAKPRNNGKTLTSYTVRGINKTIRPGDNVLMRSPELSKPSYIAKVIKIESDDRSNVKVHVQWYYRPEEVIGGRKPYNGAKEVFLSNHFDIQSADTIEGKCKVHDFKSYTRLDAIGNDDFFCRFEYDSHTGEFDPNKAVVYCKCEMPYNPDDLMIQCDGCKDWFHPNCIDMTVEEAERIENYFCESCLSKDQTILHNSHAVSRHAPKRVETKRRRRG